jgi:hypothetical protein
MSDQFMKNKSNVYVPQSAFGVCFWRMPDGGMISDSDGNYMCAEGMISDPLVEKHMREAAKYWTGSSDGEPVWKDGTRKVSQEELDLQGERLEAGLIPDPYEDTLNALSLRKGR